MTFSVSNKRVRSNRSKTVKESLSRKAGGGDIQHLASRSRELQAEIHRLEVAITQAPIEMTRRRIASRNTLPPLGPAERTSRTAQRKPLQQQRAERNRRLALYLEFAVVIVTLVATLGWLRQWLQH
jgi:hypothetical protein